MFAVGKDALVMTSRASQIDFGKIRTLEHENCNFDRVFQYFPVHEISTIAAFDLLNKNDTQNFDA